MGACLLWTLLRQRSAVLPAAASEEAERVRPQLDQAQTASRAKSELVEAAAAEVKSLLNEIVGTAGLVLGTGLEPEQRSFLDTILRSGNALFSTADNLLDLSRLLDDELVLEPCPVQLRALVAEVCELLSDTAAKRGLSLRSVVDASLPDYLLSDPVRLRQVLHTLVAYVISLTHRGETLVSCSAGDRDGHQPLPIRFELTGAGITEAAVEQILEPLTANPSSFNPGPEVSRLDLRLCAGIVALMGATIGAESAPSKGTRLVLTVQLAVAQPAPAEPRLLIAADNRSNQMITLAITQQLGYQADLAGSGAEALAALADTSYDLVLTDLRMATMDGIELTRLIRAREREGRTPIVAFGAGSSTNSSDRERCLAAGVDDYLAKPIKPEELRRVLHRWCPVTTPVTTTPVTTTATSTADDKSNSSLNPTALAELSFLSAGLVKEVAEVCIKEAPAKLANLRDAVGRGDPKPLGDVAHDLKTSSRYLGADNLADLCQDLERCARSDQMARASGLVTTVAAELEQVLTALRALK
jgi:CheY-like chemotaxis protein/nitrogen-specific signal transduction histidine kinase